MRKNLKLLILLGIVGAVLLAPNIWLWDFPQPDVATRYAPMARAFADGNWNLAFHPRIPLLFPVLAGCVTRVIGGNGYFATQISSAALFLFGLIPLFLLTRRCFGTMTARLTCGLYVFCPYLLRLGSSGLRESAKCFGFLVAAYAVVMLWRRCGRWRYYWWLALGCGMMVLTRDDSFVVAALLLLFACGNEIAHRKIPVRSIAAGILLVILILPAMAVNYHQIGYPVPSFRFVSLVQPWLKPRALDQWLVKSEPLAVVTVNRPAEQSANRKTEVAQFRPAVPAAVNPPARRNGILHDFVNSVNVKSVKVFLENTIKGPYPLYGLLALIAVFYRWRRRRLRGGEKLLLALWCGYVLAETLQIAIFDRYLYMQRRYLLPAAPVVFGWSALTAIAIYRYSQRIHKTKWLLYVVLPVLGLWLWAEALMPQIKGRIVRKHAFKREVTLEWMQKIREDFHGTARYPESAISVSEYFSWRRPRVWAHSMGAIGFLLEGESSIGDREPYAHELDKFDYVTLFRPADLPLPQYPGFTLLDVRTEGKWTCAFWRAKHLDNPHSNPHAAGGKK